MITKEDVERTTKYTEKREYSLCFHCGKQIMESHICLSINNQWGSKERFGPTGLFKYINFHIDCWKEIAGEEYCFSEE